MILTFLLVYGLQIIDKNFKNKTYFDKFKFPILATSIVGLISQYAIDSNICVNSKVDTQEIFTEIPNF